MAQEERNDSSYNESSSYDEKIKLMVIGETRVGKTALIKNIQKILLAEHT